jgi:membrane associated rhomboid family serine protease
MRSMLTPMVKNLLIINVAVFLIGIVLSNFDLEKYLALRYFGSAAFQPVQLFTYMFLHADFFHLFGNMLSLFFFGPMLESLWGAKKFLFFYVFCGIGAAIIFSAAHYYEVKNLEHARDNFNSEPSYEYLAAFERAFGQDVFDIEFKEKLEENPTDPVLIRNARYGIDQITTMVINSPVIGASGAVFGILMAFGLLFPNTELMLLFFPVPIKAKYFVLIYGAFELFMGISRVPGDNVAHFAHLGGALFGFILVKYWQKQRNTFY